MRTRSLRVKRSKGRVPQARKPPRRPRPSKPRRKPEKPRGSGTGSGARTKAGSWATSRHPLRTLERPALLYLGPEPPRSFGLRSLHALAVAELRRTPLWRSSRSGNSRKLDFYFTEFCEVRHERCNKYCNLVMRLPPIEGYAATATCVEAQVRYLPSF